MVMLAATTKHVQDQAKRHSRRRTITAAVMRTSGNSSSGGELAPQSFRFNPRIAQRVVKIPPRVRFPGLKEFGTNESDAGPSKQPGETLNKTIGGIVLQCHK
jgi:hypothetical protein